MTGHLQIAPGDQVRGIHMPTQGIANPNVADDPRLSRRIPIDPAFEQANPTL
jgi:hypothetical protein